MSSQQTTIYDTSDEFIWDSITTETAADGTILTQSTVFDSGIIQDDLYEGGKLFASIEQDTFDFTDWVVRQTLYDENGEIALQASLQDDGDEIYNIYVGGDLFASLLLDVNESETWEVSLTEQGPNGPQTTYYDNMYNVPEPYLDLLPMGAG